MAKALIDYTDDELMAELRAKTEHVNYSPANLHDELVRRAANRQAQLSFFLAIVIGLATIINVAVAIWRVATNT